MAQHKHQADWSLAAAPPPPTYAADLKRSAVPAMPARALQQLLEDSTALAGDVERWSRRRQVAFIVASCCALWMALLVASAELVRAIA